jgi:hypothetical protein
MRTYDDARDTHARCGVVKMIPPTGWLSWPVWRELGDTLGDKQRYNAGATANKYLYKWLPGLDSNQRPTD